MSFLDNPNAGAIIGAGSSLAGGIFSNMMNSAINNAQTEMQRSMFDRSQQFAREQANLAWQRQKQMSANQVAYTVQGMKSQGLNPAYMDGGFGSPSTSAPMGANPSGNAPSVIPMINPLDGVADILANVKLKRAQADNLDSQTEANEIANKRAKSFDAQIGKLTSFSADPETGQKIEDVDQWQKDHPGKLPSLVVSNMNKGDLDALDEYSRYVSVKDVRELQAFVARSQQLDPEVRDALVHIPAKQFAKLVKEVSLLSKEFEIKNNEVTISGHNAKIAEYDEELKRLGLEDYRLTSLTGVYEAITDKSRGFGEKFLLGLVFAILNANRFR